jgi:hypothetical protein
MSLSLFIEKVLYYTKKDLTIDLLTKELLFLLAKRFNFRYAYFCEMKKIDGKDYNWANTYIDTVNENVYEKYYRKEGYLFPLSEEYKNKVWAMNYYNPKKTIIDNNINESHPKRKCPIENFNNFMLKGIIYQGNYVGHIALGGADVFIDELFEKEMEPYFNLITRILWEKKIDKNVRKNSCCIII